MGKTLEQFASEINFPLTFRHLVEKETIIRGQQTKQHHQERWVCGLYSPFVGQTVYCERNLLIGFTLLPADGKTRREARRKFIQMIRGTTLKYGSDRPLSVKVPSNLR